MTKAEQILNTEIKYGKSPSFQYFFFDQHKTIESFQQGFADIGGQKKVDANTTYHVLSVTKTFTAIATLQLVERGLLELEKPVIHYLPLFQYGPEITVTQLLNHTSGIPNPIPLAWVHLESENQSFDRNAYFHQIFQKNKKVKSKPNEKLAYSNLNYVILGHLIEEVSGKTFEDYIIENIVRKLPICQDDLAFSISNTDEHAKGYHKNMSFSNLILGLFINKSKFMGKNEGKWKPFKNYYVNGAPYGGLIGKPGAFVSYVQELMNENSSLISEKYKTMMFHENQNNKGKNTGMCLGWFSGELNGVKYYAHAGGGGGYYCEIRIYPRINRGSVIFFNRTGMSDERYLDKIDRFYI